MFRLIARLDIKGANLVKGIHMEGLRVMGKPADYARRYSQPGWELALFDIVASLYGRNQLEGLLHEITDETSIPVLVGGGIHSVNEAKRLFRSGADQIAVNTAALARPELINELADCFGSQAVVLSVEAKRHAHGWQAMTNNGRDGSSRDVQEWIEEGVIRGAGEILLTSVDREGTKGGFDLELISSVAHNSAVPVIAGGGCGAIGHILEARKTGADGVAISTVLHYNILTTEAIDDGLAQSQFPTSQERDGGREAAG